MLLSDSTTTDTPSQNIVKDTVGDGDFDYDINKPETFLNKDDMEKVTDSQIYPQDRMFTFLHKIDYNFKKIFKKQKQFMPNIPNGDDERTIYPLYHANLLSQIFFLWVLPLVGVGYKRTLQPQDLYKLDDELKIGELYESFEKHWDDAIEERRQIGLNNKETLGNGNGNGNEDDENDEDVVELTKFTIIVVLFKTFYKKFMFSVLCAILGNVASALNPLLTKKLINFVEKKTIFPSLHVNSGIGYGIGASLIMLLNGIFFNHFFHMSMMMGGQVRSVLTKALLTKSFKLSGKSKHKYSNGVITSMMSTDLSRLEFAIAFHPFIWAFPFPVIIAIVLLIINLGPIALAKVAKL